MSAQVILASSSPRRHDLLNQIGLEHIVFEPTTDERMDPSWPPERAVQELARKKALAAAITYPDLPVLAADTVVVQDGRILGKPRNREHAFEMLRALSGREHQVFTGICWALGAAGWVQTGYRRTGVTISAMTDGQIRDYIKTGEPMDKAGAYAIQGIAGQWVERVDGCASNVVGLPLPLTTQMLSRLNDECKRG